MLNQTKFTRKMTGGEGFFTIIKLKKEIKYFFAQRRKVNTSLNKQGSLLCIPYLFIFFIHSIPFIFHEMATYRNETLKYQHDFK